MLLHPIHLQCVRQRLFVPSGCVGIGQRGVRYRNAQRRAACCICLKGRDPRTHSIRLIPGCGMRWICGVDRGQGERRNRVGWWRGLRGRRMIWQRGHNGQRVNTANKQSRYAPGKELSATQRSARSNSGCAAGRARGLRLSENLAARRAAHSVRHCQAPSPF